MEKIKRLSILGVLVFLSFSFSCTKEASYYNYDIPEGSILMQAGQPQRVSQYMLLEVIDIDDSRCPVGAVCTWAGNVVITFRVFAENTNFEHLFVYECANGNTSDTISKHLVNILEVTPMRFVNDSDISLRDYRILLDVDLFND